MIEIERERQDLKSLFIGSLVRSKGPRCATSDIDKDEDVIGIVLEVCTVESMSIYDGISKSNSFKILSDTGVHLVYWKTCEELLLDKIISCLERKEKHFKTHVN